MCLRLHFGMGVQANPNFVSSCIVLPLQASRVDPSQARQLWDFGLALKFCKPSINFRVSGKFRSIEPFQAFQALTPSVGFRAFPDLQIWGVCPFQAPF